MQQYVVALHLALEAVERGHRRCCESAAGGQCDEAVENRLVALAEQPLVVVGADAEIERAIAPSGIVIDDVAHQDQAGAVTRARRHGVGVEHMEKRCPSATPANIAITSSSHSSA